MASKNPVFARVSRLGFFHFCTSKKRITLCSENKEKEG
jgi:hypothetical protein